MFKGCFTHVQEAHCIEKNKRYNRAQRTDRLGCSRRPAPAANGLCANCGLKVLVRFSVLIARTDAAICRLEP